MPALERLPANVLRNLASMKSGKYGDGGGLWLLRRPDGGAQWSFRYTLYGRQREMGIGPAQDVTLAKARAEARRWRATVKDGDDPQDVRSTERSAKAQERPTFSMVMAETFEARKAQLKNDGKAGRWDSPLRVHVVPKLGQVPIEKIDQNEIRRTLAPIWHSKPEAARKAMNRIGLILKHGAAMGLPVDLQAVDKAKALLGAQRHTTVNVPALAWKDVPAFYQSLSNETVAERALKLLILTAARSGEIRFANLSEIDADVWTIPAERMKSGVEHRVPLSSQTQAVIKVAAEFSRDGFLFPGLRKGVISDMTMNKFMQRRDMNERPHGFRSSFRTWCAEATDIPREIAEACLAHSTAGKVEAAYRRTDFLERRSVLMERWAGILIGESSGSAALRSVK